MLGDRHDSYDEAKDELESGEADIFSWTNSVVRTRNHPKRILLTSQGTKTIRPELTVIMGLSGSGKTTLLNSLSGRVAKSQLEYSGQVYLRGHKLTPTDIKSYTAYVQQDDVLSPFLTVEETIKYAAKLRIKEDDQAIAERVEDVMKLLDIYKSKDVLIGDARVRGISGGERKRVCIAQEIITRPFILFCDEPTSGLDAVTALEVVHLLKNLTLKKRCAVLTTIHQPSESQFALFDKLILMSGGSVVYGPGDTHGAVRMFESITGYICHPPSIFSTHLHVDTDTCKDTGVYKDKDLDKVMRSEMEAPRDERPRGSSMHSVVPHGVCPGTIGTTDTMAIAGYTTTPEYLIRMLPTVAQKLTGQNCSGRMGIDTLKGLTDAESIAVERVLYPDSDIDVAGVSEPRSGSSLPQPPPRPVTSWCRQFAVLFERSLKISLRQSYSIWTNYIVGAVLALIIGAGVWYDIGSSQASVGKRITSLYFTVISQGVVASFQSVYSFPLERTLMLRERAAGSYGVSVYIFAKTASDILVLLPCPIIHTIVVYPMIGYRVTPWYKPFIFLAFMILDMISATSLATTVTCLCVSIEFSVGVLAMCFEVNRLYGGFYFSPNLLMTSFSGWSFLAYLAYIFYVFIGVMQNELQDLELHCTDEELAAITARMQCTSTSITPVVPVCPVTNGNQVIRENGYDVLSIGLCFLLLIVLIAFYRITAYVALRSLKQ